MRNLMVILCVLGLSGCGMMGNGKNGRDGADGRDGYNGRDGQRGQTGEVGPMGPAGKNGEKGDKGDKGDKGEPGKDGGVNVLSVECQAPWTVENGRAFNNVVTVYAIEAKGTMTSIKTTYKDDDGAEQNFLASVFDQSGKVENAFFSAVYKDLKLSLTRKGFNETKTFDCKNI